MTFLKCLGFALLVSVGATYANVDDAIRKNELVINALQEKLDSLQSKGEEASIKDLQDHIEKVIKEQNDLLAKKAAIAPLEKEIAENGGVENSMLERKTVESAVPAKNNDLEERISRLEAEISRLKAEVAKQQKPKHDAGNPYHELTEPELKATKEAEAHAPQLPEQKSKAMAQYELALEQYNKAEYKIAAASFGRIIKTYPKDPIASKALVHLAFCLEKQGDLESAAVVCESALEKKLNGTHQADCQLIRLRHAKAKGHDVDVAVITKNLQALKLTAVQKTTFDATIAPKTAAPKAAVPKEKKVESP